MRAAGHVATACGVAAAFVLLATLAEPALAAASPFGIATPDSSGGAGFGGPLGPVFMWIAIRQAAFYKSLTAALSATKANGSAAAVLIGLSFLYGVFHAAGPGHGKAVISSYLLASGETAKRGIAISFVAALVQALSAIIIVVVATIVFRVTAMTMTAATDWIEIGSYGLIALVGAWLLWSKTFGGHDHHHHHRVASAPDHGHAHGDDHRHDHDHDHEHDHRNDAHHDGHGTVAAPVANSWAGTFAKAWSAILAVGVRPCSGALIVLVFALSQGLFMIGVAATIVMALGTGLTVATLATLAVVAKGVALRFARVEAGPAGKIAHGVEIAGAAAVLVLGLLLLGGALASGARI